MKKTESLAIDNIKRIADTLRSERNDALALAQVKREQANTAIRFLEQASAHLAKMPEAAALASEIETFLAKSKA